MADQSVDAYVAHLRDIIGAAGLASPLLVGHSLGAAIALASALHHPDETSAVVAVGGGLAMPVNPDILSGFQTNPELVMDMMCKFSLARQNRAKLYDTARARLAEADPGVVYANMLACSRFDITREAKNIRVPVLAVCGREDKMTPPDLSRALARQIGGAKLSMIEGAGHTVMIEKPVEFNNALEKFAESVFPASTPLKN